MRSLYRTKHTITHTNGAKYYRILEEFNAKIGATHLHTLDPSTLVPQEVVVGDLTLRNVIMFESIHIEHGDIEAFGLQGQRLGRPLNEPTVEFIAIHVESYDA